MPDNGSQQVVVIGSSFVGFTTALELRKRLDRQHSVVVPGRRPDFPPQPQARRDRGMSR
ncbi:MAG TPA: hypothetical protein VMU55_07220 [Solirubrobacteraceae bacterium]|nr:hypothetical protein [Solirubrobacteraceae bacterium]